MRDVLKRTSNRIMGAITRGMVKLVDDSTQHQTMQVQVADDETKDAAQRVQNYGFTGVPLPGASAVVVFANGSRDHPVVIAVDNRDTRLKNLEPGEVAVYTHEGAFIKLKNGRVIEIECDQLKITAPGGIEMTGETIKMTASSNVETVTPLLKSTGDILDKSGSGGHTMAAFRTIYNSHTHKENNVLNGDSKVPTQTI